MEKELALKFKPYLDNPLFVEVLRLVRQNSEGKIWLLGGFLYRNLIKELYEPHREIYTADIDFFVEKRNDTLKNISGWQIYTNSYGAENYTDGNIKVSFTQLNKAIRETDKSPNTIRELLQGTPFTIQSIACDVDTCEIINEGGVEAIIQKVIGINNKIQAEFYARRHATSIEKILKEKAEGLGFKVFAKE